MSGEKVERVYIPTGGSKLATFRAVRAWLEKIAAADGKKLPECWYKDGPEDQPDLYSTDDQLPEGENR